MLCKSVCVRFVVRNSLEKFSSSFSFLYECKKNAKSQRMANNFQFPLTHTFFTFSDSLSRQSGGEPHGKYDVIFFLAQLFAANGNFSMAIPILWLFHFRSWSCSPENHQHLTTMHARDKSACVFVAMWHGTNDVGLHLSFALQKRMRHNEWFEFCTIFSIWLFDKSFGVRFGTTRCSTNHHLLAFTCRLGTERFFLLRHLW